MTTDAEVVIVHRSPTKRKGFAQIPHAVLTDPTLSDSAIRLYGILLSYAFQADAFKCSQEKMAADIHKDDRTVRRLLKVLSNRGLVTAVRTGNREVNAYILEDAYALYDSEQPKPKKRERIEIRPDKNVRSPDRTKMSGHGGQKCPVMEDKNVLLLNNSLEESNITNKQPAQGTFEDLAENSESALVSELVSFGVSWEKARQVIKAYGEVRCREVLKATPDLTPTRRQASWILKALAEGWQMGEPPRSWKIGADAGRDIDQLISAHGLPAVLVELERRAAESERSGKADQAARRRFIITGLRDGMTGVEAVAAAKSPTPAGVT